MELSYSPTNASIYITPSCPHIYFPLKNINLNPHPGPFDLKVIIFFHMNWPLAMVEFN